jgi:DNA-damage-inducible protein J
MSYNDCDYLKPGATKMSKTAFVRARIEPELKEQTETVLKEIGLSTSEAVTMFFRQIVMQRGLPFAAKIPNAETIAAFNEDLSDAVRVKNVEEMMEYILSEED